jgi:hypothetical protein
MALETTIATECPSEGERVELVEGRLDGAARARTREHVATCSGCAALLAGLGSGEVEVVHRDVKPSNILRGNPFMMRAPALSGNAHWRHRPASLT